MSRSSFLVMGGAALLAFSAALVCVDARPVLAGGQEPEVRAPAAGRRPGAQGSRDFLGLGPAPDAAAAKLGEPLFQANCSACHGTTARGATGPNLLRSVLVLHDEKGEEIGQVIQNGRAQGGMPAFPNLTQVQIYNIAEYLHLQVELAANRGLYKHSDTMTSGDLAQGRAYFAAHCASCHSVTGDMAGIGTKFAQPAAMLARIAWPSTRGARQATVTTATGETLHGTLMHYDDFETTLKTADGATRTWPTAQVKVEIADTLAGHRALLPQYSDDDLHDLTRYLMTLK